MKKFILMIIMMVILPLNVMAKSEITLNVDKSLLRANEEVLVTAKLKSDKKLYALLATLSYDENVFEKIDDSNFTSMDDWSDIEYNQKNKKFGLINKSGEVLENLLSVKLKVKEDCNVGDSSIILSNISASDGENKITFADSEVKVFVGRDAKEGEAIPKNEEKEEVKSEEEIKKVFSDRFMIIGIELVVILFLIICILANIIKTKHKKQITWFLCILMIILFGVLIYFVILNNSKADVNKDGVKDYEDAKEIIKYLIDVEGTIKDEEKEFNPNVYVSDNSNNQNDEQTNDSINNVENNSSNTVNSNQNYNTDTNDANEKNDVDNSSTNNNNSDKPSNNHKPNNDGDVDGDGDVDIDDAGDIVEENTNRHYSVKLEEIVNKNKYYHKDEDISFDFSAVVSPSEVIKKVYIDGNYYDVINNTTYYSVVMPFISTSGVHELNISKVVLSNKKEVNTNLKIKVEVLKDEPYVNKFVVDEETKDISFMLVDDENSISNGKVVISNLDGDIIYTSDIKVGFNSFNYDFEKDQKYRLSIYADYDLDSNSLNDITGEANNYSDAVLLEKEICINTVYNFKIDNIKITDVVLKDEDVVIYFNSSNDSDYKPDYVIVDDHSYKVIPNENNYKVILPTNNNYGKYEVNFEKVILSNGKEFEVNNRLSYYVLKSEPRVTDIQLSHSDNKILVKYNLKDEDNTVSKLKALLIDSEGNIVLEKDCLGLNGLEFIYEDSYKYTVMFVADYSLGIDDFKYVEQAIGEKDIFVNPQVYFTGVSLNKVYAHKNEDVYVYYELHVPANFKPSGYPKNITNLITGMTINGLNYVATRNSEANEIAKYTVSFKVPNEAGPVTIKANKVNFFDTSTYDMEEMPITLEVLKDKPTVKNFKLDSEDYENKRATFSFEITSDNGGFDEGYIKLGEESIKVNEGLNTVTFENIKVDEDFKISIYGNYDLDTNTLDNEHNYVSDDLLYEFNYGLYNPSNYENISIDNISNNNYANKNEPIPIDFKVNGLNHFEIAKVNVLDKYYDVEKIDDKYRIIIDGFNNAGIKNIVISKILLSNGKEVNLKENANVRLEILKSKLSISDFNYQVNDKDISVNFKVNDSDNSLKSLNVKVVDENDELVGNYRDSEFKFNKKDNVKRYYLTIYANYDLDENILTNGDNYYYEVKVLEEVVSLDNNKLELKNINDIVLYKDDEVISEVNIKDLENNLSNYFVEITMSDMPTIYSKIKSYNIKDNNLYFILETDDLEICYGKVISNKAINSERPETLEDLIKKIMANPSGEFVLSHDYDASNITSETNSLIDVEFKGTLDGNGHYIKNLSKPLFKSLSSAKIKDLKLVNVLLPSVNAHGSLSDNAVDSEFSNILIEGLEKTNNESNVGSLVGNATNCHISNSKVSGLKYSSGIYDNRLGGLVGDAKNTEITNCYVNGSISGGWQFLGGITGSSDDKTKISNCYVKGSIVNSFGYAGYLTLGGITGSNNGILSNNISLITTEYGYGIASGNNVVANNNYQIPNSGYTLNEGEGYKTINKEDINKEFFIKQALFSENIWDFKNTSYDNLPTLKIEFKINNEIKENDLYNPNKEMLYHNLSLLMPFYDYDKVLENGLNISEDHILNKEEIKHLIPLDSDNHLVTYLTKNDYRKINKIKIILSNDEVLEYNVLFDKLYNVVVGYRIKELKIDYSYNHYLIDEDLSVVKELVNYLSSLDYSKDLDSITSIEDSRLYRDYYNEVTKNELKEFVLKYLSNSDYNVSLNDSNVSNHILEELKKDDKIKKVLYVYNYFRRFYSFEINGVMFNDLMFFNSNGFNSFLNPVDISNLYLSNESNFNTNGTNDAYNRTLAKYTKINNIPYLIEYFVKALSNDSPDEWFRKTFKGILVEVGGNEEITYSMWSHLRHPKSVWYNHTLVILTLPENAAYIISSPTQFLIGATRTYVNDPVKDKEILMSKINEYATNIDNYFKTASLIIEEAKYFNDIHTITLDNRFTLDSNNRQVYQSKLVTEEPFHKNFNEAVNLWKEMDGNAATSNGTVVFFNAYTALSAYPTWTHEMAHNFDARLFLKNNGRRYDAGGEDYSDGNLAQRWGEGDINMNLTYDFEPTKNLATNLTRERINSPSKIKDFYQKEFETIYLLDYLEAQAFLQLTSAEQASIVTEVYYPNIENETEHLKYKVTGYRKISEEEISKMELKTINDLYDHHLVIYPGVKDPISYGDNKYGTENIFRTRWYQAYNDYGRPDSYTLKFFAYEMLGYAGYDNGYIEYYSNINNNGDKDKTKTDLMALRKITNNPTITFDSYRKGCFEEVKNNLKYYQYIDVNQVVKDFYNALKEDAKNNDRDLKARREVRKNAFFKIKMESNDFRKDVIDKKNPHEVGDFKINP